jgi:hypothetical protein
LKQLENTQVLIKGSPTDIVAVKGNIEYFFEIKMTKQTDSYFGAATLTEWITAFMFPNNFKFVIAKTDFNEEHFEFTEYSPEIFMKHSTIPPFKIYFNVNLQGETKIRKRKSAIPLTNDSLHLLAELYKKIKT